MIKKKKKKMSSLLEKQNTRDKLNSSWNTGTGSTWWCARCHRCCCSVCILAPAVWDKWCEWSPGPDGCRTPRAARGSCSRTCSSVPPACLQYFPCWRNSTGGTASMSSTEPLSVRRPLAAANGHRACRSTRQTDRCPTEFEPSDVVALTIVDGHRHGRCSQQTVVVSVTTSSTGWRVWRLHRWPVTCLPPWCRPRRHRRRRRNN